MSLSPSGCLISGMDDFSPEDFGPCCFEGSLGDFWLASVLRTGVVVFSENKVGLQVH